MITRIELDGFKTFQDFSLDLSPLQIIVGANGVGKSNLFNALQLLARLAQSGLSSAFEYMSQEQGELFTVLPGGASSDRMRLAVELLVNKNVQDDYGTRRELKFTRLRYELEVARAVRRDCRKRLTVEHELLFPIPRQSDQWTKSNKLLTGGPWIPALTGGRSTPFISSQKKNGAALILHQDGNGGRRQVKAVEAERTLLSGAVNVEFPHAFAAAEEMRAWRFLNLNTSILRQPCHFSAPATMAADGSNLPSVLARMRSSNLPLLATVSEDLAHSMPGVVQVEVEDNSATEQFAIWARTQDGRRFSSQALSEGTLRMLALVALRNDPEHEGLLCFEDPENNVHPSRLKVMAEILRDLATDFSDPEQADLSMRQLFCNTHSPVFISQPEILSHVLFAHLESCNLPENAGIPLNVTRILPVIPDPLQPQLPIAEEVQSFTLSEVQSYLESADLGEARRHLGEKLALDNGVSCADGVAAVST